MPKPCKINRTWNYTWNHKQCVQAGFDDWGVAKGYQGHLWHKTWHNSTDINICENIRLIQGCITMAIIKFSPKGNG